ncbi:MATE family efflux transporter [Anaerococcus porci]|uniref:Probable multidrug resistance protein NorM n=1 Tax=Anaerococcus porci TaxID=2652269 RepID=A0A6N7VY59_9FIRM|nr:MATE family efflux transporter [Anaerococcus porci]MDY3006350.1 MATE family efflux transporter [Anaerococcus porci]MSS78777.1 MATE family efflux transporter [Anaerococcus porci]
MEKRRDIDLTKENIRKSLIKLSIPLTLTAFVQIAYTLVDMIWIGRLGSGAVAAVGVSYFLAWIAEALGLISKIGGGVYASQAYGRKDIELTSLILKNSYIQGAFISIIYIILILIFKRVFIGFYNLGSEVSTLADNYITITSLGYFFVFLNPIFSQSFYSIGESITPFKINTLGLVLNIVLDPIFIFGLGPIPAIGIKGAALATVTGQACVFITFIFVMIKKEGIVADSLKNFTFSRIWQKRIFILGLPVALISGIHALITIVLNKLMANFGPKPVAVYSIGSQLESISWKTTEGCQVVIQSLIAQNYGARLIKRVKKSVKEGLRLVGIIGFIATLILFIFRNYLFKIFIPDDMDTIALGAQYLAILSASQFMQALEIGSTGIFQGLSDTRTPAFISVVLNAIRIPLSFAFIPFMGVMGIWFSMTISSILKGIISLYLLRKKIKKNIVYIKD